MKQRSESAFGLHFDFHAKPESCGGKVGRTLREEDIRAICRVVKPDFIQTDCKGHPGWASYPTKCGNAMPEFAQDTLALWRRVTAEEDVALYLHYSGVWDQKYCTEHPEGCVTRADGSKSECATRTMGTYIDDLLIPQLKEMADYGVNGVWVDGECWGTEADFHPDTVAAFEKETGISLGGKLPAKRDDPYFEEYRAFCRELFRRYLRRYVDVVHAAKPGFRIASNWAFTDHMPERVSANVDFLSGDFNPTDSVSSARYAGRAIAQQEMTWDLMAWNFRMPFNEKAPGHLIKTVAQIKQEAAMVISLGGGFQDYITQYPDGGLRMEEILPLAEVGKFIRERQDYCFRGKAVPQVAVLLSTYDRNRESDGLYSRNGMEKIMGMTCLLCDTGHTNAIVSEHKLQEYPVIVVPELYAGLAKETVEWLMQYAENGGNLLLIGKNTCRLFEKYGSPVRVGETVAESAYMGCGDGELGMTCDYCGLSGDMRFFAQRTPRAEKTAVAVVERFGKGKIAAVGFDLGSEYHRYSQSMHRKMAKALLGELYTPLAEVIAATELLEVNCLEKNGRLMVQLVNANGQHRSPVSATEDMIPPCLDVEMRLRLAKEPAAIRLQPAGKDLPFRWENGFADVHVGRVDIHEILEIIDK